jgi:hypothetical protein
LSALLRQRESSGTTAAHQNCNDCHTEVGEDKAMTDAALKQACIGCHDDDPAYGTMVDEWRREVEALNIEGLKADLVQIQKSVLMAIRNGDYTYGAQDLLNNAEKNLKLLDGNPIHNLKFAKELTKKITGLLGQAKKQLQRHSTIKTLSDKEYKY